MPALGRLERIRRRLSGAAAFGDSELLHDLDSAGENLRRAAELTAELFAAWPDDSSQIRAEIAACETHGDELTRKIVHSLHRSKAPPSDRSDVYKLAGAIDDVVDDIEEAAEETAIYRIEAPMEQAERLSGVLRDAARDLAQALGGLDRIEGVEPCLQGVRRREQEGDRIYREALAALFDGGIDPMLVVRWKDVLAAIEDAIDRCRAAADILQGIIVRHA